MPFDGIVTKCITEELKDLLQDGRIEKIFQPEADEILMNLRAKGLNHRLLLSANANYPRLHLTSTSKDNPAIAPVFCMLLRKHLSGGRIVDIEFHDFERIVTLHIESTNEMGDTSIKRLIIEIMGRHSNIILVNSENKIIDAIKHVDIDISRVREVMPAREYILPPVQNKIDPLALDSHSFILSAIKAPDNAAVTIEKMLLNNIKGFSPLICREICFKAGLDSKTECSDLLLQAEHAQVLIDKLQEVINQIKSSEYFPSILLDSIDNEKPLDFHCLNITQNPLTKLYGSMSLTLDAFYSTKDNLDRLKQKKGDLTRVLTNALDRCNKKLFIQEEKLREVANREKLQLYGELITANIYCLETGIKSAHLLNYYSAEECYVDIPMDVNLSSQQNAQRYYKKFAKAKSTFSYTTVQLQETKNELVYLESVLLNLESAITIQEIEEIREELVEEGYTSKKTKVTAKKSGKKKPNAKKREKESPPLHYTSVDGYDIFVGKNNRQNDQLTLKTAGSNDMWFHTKNIPGSHVIIRKQQGEIPDTTLLDAAMLAAYHSKAKMSSNVPVDCTQVRNVKKPSGAKPGMVIYENFKTIIVTPNEIKVKTMDKNKKSR